MIQLISNIIRIAKTTGHILLLVVFLTPMTVKFFHHHEPVKYIPGSPQNSTSYQEKCAICNFEFSLFSQQNDKIFSQPTVLTDHYCNHYSIGKIVIPFINLFRLRAPPFRQS